MKQKINLQVTNRDINKSLVLNGFQRVTFKADRTSENWNQKLNSTVNVTEIKLQFVIVDLFLLSSSLKSFDFKMWTICM